VLSASSYNLAPPIRQVSSGLESEIVMVSPIATGRCLDTSPAPRQMSAARSATSRRSSSCHQVWQLTRPSGRTGSTLRIPICGAARSNHARESLLATSLSGAGSLRFCGITSLFRRRNAGIDECVLKSLVSRVTATGRALRRVGTALREASQPAAPVFGLVTDLFRPRRLLLAENVLLRQQLLVLRRQIKRPNLTAFDRAVPGTRARSPALGANRCFW